MLYQLPLHTTYTCQPLIRKQINKLLCKGTITKPPKTLISLGIGHVIEISSPIISSKWRYIQPELPFE